MPPSSERGSCIYCGDPLAVDTSPAHVLPNGLGGRKTSTRTVCTACNGETAKDEGNLCEALREVTGFIGMSRGDGKPVPPAIKELPGFGRVAIWGGIPARRSTSIEEREAEKRHEFTISVPEDLDRAALQLAHQLRKLGKTPSDVDSGVVDLRIENRSEFLGGVPVAATIDGDSHRRALAKIPLELLAWHQPSLARDSALDTARSYVRYYQGALAVQRDETSPGSGLIDRTALPDFVNAVEVWSAGSQIIGTVDLLGLLRFSVPLADHWDGRAFAAAYAVDAVEGRAVIDEWRDEGGPLPQHWPTREAITEEEREARQAAFGQKANKHVVRRATAQLAHEVVQKWAEAMGDAQIATREDLDKLASMAADEATVFIRRLSRTKPIDLEEILPLVQKHFDELAKRDH